MKIKYKNKIDFYNVLLFSLLTEKYELEKKQENFNFSFNEWIDITFERHYNFFMNKIKEK